VKRRSLLVILVSLVVDDVEEAELVDTLGGGDDAEPVTELLLLEELLGAVSTVSELRSPTCHGGWRRVASHRAAQRRRENIQVLQVAAGELLVSNDLDLAIALLGDLDDLAEVAGAALNLDAVVEELLEGLDVEDLVVDGLRAVDDELLGHLRCLLRASLLSCTLAYCSMPEGAHCCLLSLADSKAVDVRLREPFCVSVRTQRSGYPA
jgi:hypothetical protein